MPLYLSGAMHCTSYQPTTAAAVKIAAAANAAGPRLIQSVGASDCNIGPAGVTASGAARGWLLKGGQTPPDSYVDASGSDLWAIGNGGTADLTVVEIY